MKDFFKYTLATITGLLITSFLIFFLFITAIISMIPSSSDTETVVAENSVFTLKLAGILNERGTSNPIRELLVSEIPSTGLKEIIESIQKAKDHPNIKGIYLDAANMSASFASLEAIRNALLDFKTSDKFIISYADQYTQGEYYLASVADEIHVNPKGSVNWMGLSSNPMFYSQLLKKIGVDMQIFKVGTYKSAVEPYIETSMSKENKEQVHEYLTDIWSHVLEGVSTARGIEIEALNQYADQMMLFQPSEACINARLVDKLSYRSDMDEVLEDKIGSKPKLLSLNKLQNVSAKTFDKKAETIAVYYASGAIVDQLSKYSDESIVSDKVIKDLKKIEDNERIKSVVIRINSPGGSAYASEQIWKAIMNLKAKKPVTISMSDVAASGGYYMAAAGDYIVAEPTTLTGSIGIFAMIPNFKGTTDKIGLNFDVVKTNKHADFGALGRALTTDEGILLQNYVNEGYELFVQRCADGRNMTTDQIKEIAEGRVWSGKKAKELGLVDELGGLDRAIEIAAEKAAISNYRVHSYPRQKELFEQIMELSAKDMVQSFLLNSDMRKMLNETLFLEQLQNESILQARLPYLLNIQ